MKQKQIKNIIKIWRKCKEDALMWDLNNVQNSLDVGLAKEYFIKKLEKLKYKCIGDGAYKLVFSKKSVDFVAKIYHNGSIDDKLMQKEDFSPYIVESAYSDGVIKIQAKANRANKNKAYKFFENIFGKEYCEIFDIHSENVGWINNKPVIFDFVACQL